MEKSPICGKTAFILPIGNRPAAAGAVEGMAATPAGSRLLSLDVFRGATIAAMLLVNNPGTLDAVYAPLRHAEWHGWTFTDLVFPFFLWIVGAAITLSLARRVAGGDGPLRLVRHAVRRAAIIFALGLLFSDWPTFDLATLRIPGVLQRIAVCYLIAVLIFVCGGLRALVAWTAGFMALYWALMALFPVPGVGAGLFEKSGNCAQYIDSLLLGRHNWSATRTWDPEGIVSTLPAISTTLFGVLTGRLLAGERPPAEKSTWMFLAGNILIVAGLALDVWMPINKNLWTVPFALFTAGMAESVFAACYWLIDVRGHRWWTQPFAVYGMNPIAIYLLAEIAAGLLLIVTLPVGGGRVSLKEFIFRRVFAPLVTPVNASLLYAVCFVLVFYLIAYVMYRRRWFIKV